MSELTKMPELVLHHVFQGRSRGLPTMEAAFVHVSLACLYTLCKMNCHVLLLKGLSQLSRYCLNGIVVQNSIWCLR